MIGSGLFNLYRLTGASGSSVKFSFETQAAEQAGIVISIIAVALALAGIAMSRRILPSLAARTQSHGSGSRLAHELALGGIVLIGFGAADEAFAWWGTPSALSGLFKGNTPETSAELVLFGAIVLLMGAVAVGVVGLSSPGWRWVLARLAPRYRQADLEAFGRKVPVHGRVRECLQLIEPGGRLLDVGCSSGWLAAQSHAKGVSEYVGLDPSIVEPQLIGPDTRFISGSALDLPFDSGTFDIVCLFDVIEHLPRGTEIRALDEAHRVLRPGGKLYLSTPHASVVHTPLDPNWYVGHRHYRRATVKWLLELTGFTLERQLVAGGIIECLDYLRWLIYKYLLRRPVPDIPAVRCLIDRSHGTDHPLGLTMFVVATARRRNTN
jgi:SAM-dependent methyltransferase